MSKPRFRWWQYAIKMVRDFPALDTAGQLSADDQRDRNAVAGAIEATMQQPQGEQWIAIIQGVYWGKQSQTIEEVAMQLSISDMTADRWHGDFIREVGKCWGFDTEQPPKKRGPRPKKIKIPS